MSTLRASVRRAGLALGFYFPADSWAVGLDLQNWPAERSDLVSFHAERRSVPAGSFVWYGFHRLRGDDLLVWSDAADNAADLRRAMLKFERDLWPDP
jgi:hypothetical protein